MKKLLAGMVTGLFMFGIATTHVNAATSQRMDFARDSEVQ